MSRGTKEMMQPCPLHLHGISLVSQCSHNDSDAIKLIGSSAAFGEILSVCLLNRAAVSALSHNSR